MPVDWANFGRAREPTKILEKLIAELAGEGISLVRVRRAWDSAAWPEARRGFFAFREKAAALIA